jgi:hypothetical protein
MLQLKPSQQTPVTFSIKRKNPVFTSTFLRILAIVFFLHLIPLFIFRIDTSTYKDPPPTLPINLNADIGISKQSETSLSSIQVDDNGLLPRYVLEPETLLPQLPDLPNTHIEKNVKHQKDKTIFEKLFYQIEHTPYEKESLDLPLLSKTPKIKVQLAGYLSELEMEELKLPPLFFMNIPSSITDDFHVLFKVKVDERKGEIFWYTLQSSSQVDYIDDLSEEILKTVRFKPSRSGSIVEGEIDLLLYIPKR